MKMTRFDGNKKFIIGTIIKNNRLDAYERYIDYAKHNGYKICSMREFYFDFLKDNPDKHFVLRHDVDDIGICTRKMFERELKMDVKSTYYFRFSTIDLALIKDMKIENFEVGFHYESLSDYAIQNNIKDSKEVDWEQAKLHLKNDIIKFQEIVGFEVDSICSHGAQKNIQLGISNNYIFEKEPYAEYGVKFEAYDKDLYEKYVNCHIMDAGLHHHYGFSYKNNPIEEIELNTKNIVFLAHPNHWFLSKKQWLWSIKMLLLNKAEWGAASRQFRRVQGEN